MFCVSKLGLPPIHCGKEFLGQRLPSTQQTTLLRTINTFLEVAVLESARR